MSVRRRLNPHLVFDTTPLVNAWILRILIPLRGHRNFVNSRGLRDDSLAQAIGLEDSVDKGAREDILRKLRVLHRKAEKEVQDLHPPEALLQSIERLSNLIGLTEADRKVLAFIASMRNDSALKAAAECLHNLAIPDACNALALLLGLPIEDVRATLHHDGLLLNSGIVSVTASRCDLYDKLQLISDEFTEKIMLPDMQPCDLLRSVVKPAAIAELSIEDYPHLKTSVDIMVPYLRSAIDSCRTGVNVFLHGPPGTGKTQLARALAARLACELYEVSAEDDDGDPTSGERRLRALRAAQCVFGKGESLVVFDEVEDVFAASFFERSVAQKHKGWMNRMLEGNGAPTLWLSNSIDGIDPAFLRRFDMVLEVSVPPRTQRERTVRAICGDLVDETTVAQLAECDALAPAVVARAMRVVRTICGGMDCKQTSAMAQQLVDNTLEAQGHSPLRTSDAIRLPTLYDPGFVHADTDLHTLAEGLAQSRSGRLCLYGPPGTGKTAFGRWLARHLDMPLSVKRVSDLVSPWLGMTEQNLAKAFRDAEREGAILLIDEVDSFLQDRRNAQRSWEVTEVNEMLTQMEAFPGIFIASTNLMTGLDQAALRRFDLKIRFDFLKPTQAAELLRRHCAELGLPEPEHAEEIARQQLRNLTPGDFAAVRRQQRFRPIASTAALVAALRAECSVKEAKSTAIGFLH